VSEFAGSFRDPDNVVIDVLSPFAACWHVAEFRRCRRSCGSTAVADALEISWISAMVPPIDWIAPTASLVAA